MEKEIADILLRSGAVSVNVKKPFRYASGILSPIYCDNRVLISEPENREIIVGYFVDLVKDYDVDVIAGTATAGIPWAAWVADRLKKPMVFVRKEAKSHGKGKQIEGVIKKGQTVVVIEDLISTGGSSFAAVEALRAVGAKVLSVIAIFTYEMASADELFSKGKCEVKALTKISALVDDMDKKDRDKVLEWGRDPAKWEEKMGFLR
ncbi:MAG: orotate phosphoribosyltransferase [Nanoarchaeota archaeon]|nr:orotate phosphoribosyltransferase [Nanoarchaeota archaeon]MBU1704701.1 orotate phosphoribosyltransferase [Nanoarchaeota archaeon]